MDYFCVGWRHTEYGCFAFTGSGLDPWCMVSSADQCLLITTSDDYISKVNIRDGSAVYKHQGLFSLTLLTSELFFYCKPKQMEICSVEQAGSCHLNWLEIVN